MPAQHYDDKGRPSGYTDDSGRHYDGQGHLTGYTDNSGRHFDDRGRPAGYIDDSGRHYDSQGHLTGYTDSSGRHYDNQGHSMGFSSGAAGAQSGWSSTTSSYSGSSSSSSNSGGLEGLAIAGIFVLLFGLLMFLWRNKFTRVLLILVAAAYLGYVMYTAILAGQAAQLSSNLRLKVTNNGLAIKNANPVEVCIGVYNWKTYVDDYGCIPPNGLWIYDQSEAATSNATACINMINGRQYFGRDRCRSETSSWP